MDGDLAAGEGVGVGARLPAGRKCRAARGEMRRARFARAEGVGSPEGEARAAKWAQAVAQTAAVGASQPVPATQSQSTVDFPITYRIL